MCGFLCVIYNCLLIYIQLHLPWRRGWLPKALLFQVKFAASASHESLLEMHNLRPHPRSTESESALLPKLQANHLCINIWEALVSKNPNSWEPSFIPPWYTVQYSVQSLSYVQLFATPWTAVHQASLSITNSRSPLKLMSIESVMPSNCLILCHPLLLLPSIFPSIRVFSNESVLCIRWPNDWTFSFNISPSNEYSGMISFRMDWLDLPEVESTIKSLLQHHSLKVSILQKSSAFFIVQPSHPYMTTGKTIALTRWTLVDKVMFLLFNMLSRLVITCLPRSKHLLISWLQSPSAVILEPPKNKVNQCFPIHSPWSGGTRCYDLSFLNVDF